ncbi:SMC-Scp complex subunit ScpB [Cytobacillus sp. IB215665]|uniref:SMC-Scp complex subunit ScpB n=1 Tax=Cytobacillus sp. IB215665 TaxID=3097357 RepID=UPI002A0D13F3|nr:SMC-Scp complex subunit ScpB [Cytobacillus sp. IB215665]MDX8364784.1 SMC-Scp complex subunit ScpB [Cytobacillus sp. IB215665]
MNIVEWKAVVEGLLFVAGDDGLSLKQIALVLEIDENVAHDIIIELQEEYKNNKRGLFVSEVANTYQLTTKKEHAAFIKRLVESPASTSLSQAALETLAIVAYRQPIARTEVEEIRGVKTERPLQTLMAKALIKEVGRVEGTGRAILYGTTKEFLEYFGLRTLEELPPLPEQVQEESVQEEADLFFEKFQEIE